MLYRLAAAIATCLVVHVTIFAAFPVVVVAVGSPNEACVICSFLMESVDRIIKAQPASMNGNSFSLGRVDFGGGVVGPEGVGGGSVGENQALRDQGPGNLLSSYPGAGFQGPMLATLLETKALTRASRRRRRERSNSALSNGHAKASALSSSAATASLKSRFKNKLDSSLNTKLEKRSLRASPPGADVDEASSDLDDEVYAQSIVDQTNTSQPTNAQKETAVDDVKDFIDSKSDSEKAKFKERELDTEDSEKDLEFAQTYKQFMDALEETCKYDIPEKYSVYCKTMFDKGEKVVEYYLHDYDDEDICTYVSPACKSYFALSS